MHRYTHSLLAVGIATLLFQGCGGGANGDDSGSGEIIEAGTPSQTPSLEENGDKSQTPKGSNRHIYHIVKKIEYRADQNITTDYSYDAEGYLSKKDIVSTSGVSEHTHYAYLNDHTQMTAKSDTNQILYEAFFTSKSDEGHDYIYDRRLSFDKDHIYLLDEKDPLAYYHDRHIDEMVPPNGDATKYYYDANDLLKKVEYGTERGDEFVVDQYANYIYDENGAFEKVNFYLTNSAKEFKVIDINCSFYSDGTLEDMNLSTKDRFHYDKQGYLKEVTHQTKPNPYLHRYNYSKDKKEISISDQNGKTVKKYIFEESKGE